MIIVNCSRQFAVDHPERRPLYRRDGNETLYPFLDEEHEDDMTYYVPALVEEEDLEKYVELSAKAAELKKELDEIKSNFGMDADAYNSVDNRTTQYSLTYGGSTMFAKDSTKVQVLSGEEASKCGVENLVIPNEITYKVGDEWKHVVTAILKDNIGTIPTDETAKLINRDLGGTPSDEKALLKKLRKKYDSNVKLFMTTYGMDEDLARRRAWDVELAYAYDELFSLSKLMNCTMEEAKAFVKKHMIATTSQSVGLTTSTV